MNYSRLAKVFCTYIDHGIHDVIGNELEALSEELQKELSFDSDDLKTRFCRGLTVKEFLKDKMKIGKVNKTEERLIRNLDKNENNDF